MDKNRLVINNRKICGYEREGYTHTNTHTHTQTHTHTHPNTQDRKRERDRERERDVVFMSDKDRLEQDSS